MDLALNNLQRLICHKPKQTLQCSMIAEETLKICGKQKLVILTQRLIQIDLI